MKTVRKTEWGETLQGRPEDKRAFRRFGVSLTVLARMVSDKRQLGEKPERMAAALVTNASVSGLEFVSSQWYPSGSQVEMQICLGARVYMVQAVIRRSQALRLPGRHTFQCAAQLTRTEAANEFIPAIAKYLLQQAER